MPKYVMKQLTCYAHPTPDRPQHCLFLPNLITYGKDTQAPMPTDDSPLLDNAGKKRIQQVVGSFRFYALSIDPTIIMALSDIATQQAALTENTKKHIEQLLDYMWTHPNAKMCYCTSNMILNVHSDALYLSTPHARSCTGGYFFLGSLPINGNPIKLNGAIHITCTILKLVAASAAEAELGALFLNAQEAKVPHLTLNKLGHPQPPTSIHIDITTTVGIVNNTIKQKCYHVMEMRYFWLLDGNHNNTSSFIISPGKKTWVIIHLNTTQDIHKHVWPYYVHTNKTPALIPQA
jgi:hypothetical protein